MPMRRILLLLGCVPLLCLAQSVTPRPRKPNPPEPPQIECPLRPAECQVNAPVFNFGRAEMSSTAPPVDSYATISVTCTRAPVDRLEVGVDFELQAQPPTPARQMRNQIGGGDASYLGYDMYLDPARTRYWGDGTQGTFTMTGRLTLDNRNRVGSLAFPIYGRVRGGQTLIAPGQWLGAVITRVKYNPVCLGGSGGGP
jgi:spore coat protein U-like protein